MKSKVQLITLLLEEFDATTKHFGLCSSAKNLCRRWIYTDEEYKFVIATLKKEYLSLGSKFTRNPSYRRYSANELHNYWWAVNPEGRKQRILFLKHIISKLDEKPKTPKLALSIVDLFRYWFNKLRRSTNS
jgi:hypothetical protein